MIRAKNTWALALVLCAGLWACGGGGGSDGGSGGSGGSGGTGGTGGGDPIAECGNNVKEAGEECDDGNRTSGDGCDSTCKIEEQVGACDDPVDYRGEATLAKPYRYVMGTIDADAAGRIQGSCGGEGGEAVFSFMAEGDGLLEWLVAEARWPPQYAVTGVSSYVLGTCEESAQDSCVLDSAWGTAEIKAGQSFIVVDAVEPLSEDLDFSLITIFRLFKNKGESCDPTGEKDICRTGLACKGDPAICDDADAPVITRSALYYGEDPSYIIAEGTDEEGDVIGYYLEPLDSNGTPLKVFDFTGDGVGDESKAFLQDSIVAEYTGLGFMPNPDGTFSLVLPLYYTMPPFVDFRLWDLSEPVAAIRLTLVDAAGMEGETVTVGPPAIAGLGEACDHEGFTNCDTGLVCKGEPSVCEAGTAPVLTKVVYADRGDRGGVTLHLAGTDPDDDVSLLKFEAMDENGEPKGYDIDGDGVAEPATIEFGMTGLSRNGEFRGSLALATAIPKIALTVIDASGLSGVRTEYDLVPMVWLAEGEACDPFYADCDSGLLCKGEPLACAPGAPPVILNAAFADQNGDPRLMVLVTDEDGDLVNVTMTLKDAEGNPTAYDIFSNGTPVGPTLDLTIADYFDCTGNTCLADFILRDEFLQVPAMAFEAIDGTGLASGPVDVVFEPLPTREHGEACNEYGFDVCPEGDICAGEGPTCITRDELRTQLCEAAPVIEVTGPGNYTATGVVDLPSLWDQPAGCAEGNPTGRPEGLVILSLANQATKVTINTNNEETIDGLYDGDTILYVTETACGTGAALACHDDVDYPGGIYGSTVVLNNVTAGEYTIVVDTWYTQSAKGSFLVEVTVE